MSIAPGAVEGSAVPTGSALEVLRAFPKLGFTCYGGPIAHNGYFRDEFVDPRRWLDETSYANLVALRQSLPGAASSQVGRAIAPFIVTAPETQKSGAAEAAPLVMYPKLYVNE